MLLALYQVNTIGSFVFVFLARLWESAIYRWYVLSTHEKRAKEISADWSNLGLQEIAICYVILGSHEFDHKFIVCKNLLCTAKVISTDGSNLRPLGTAICSVILGSHEFNHKFIVCKNLLCSVIIFFLQIPILWIFLVRPRGNFVKIPLNKTWRIFTKIPVKRFSWKFIVFFILAKMPVKDFWSERLREDLELFCKNPQGVFPKVFARRPRGFH